VKLLGAGQPGMGCAKLSVPVFWHWLLVDIKKVAIAVGWLDVWLVGKEVGSDVDVSMETNMSSKRTKKIIQSARV
jgi:hypothetical protein